MPTNIKRFEILSYLAICIGIIHVAIKYSPHLVERADPSAFAFYILDAAVGFGILFLLVWLAARRRQDWARWVDFAFFCLGIAIVLSSAFHITGVFGNVNWLDAIQYIINAAAFYFVFTGDTPAWFARSKQQ